MNTPLPKSAAKFALNAINKFISAEHLASVELVDLHIAAGKLSDALEAEQAQAVFIAVPRDGTEPRMGGAEPKQDTVKPYGWMVSGVPTVMRGSLAQEIQEQEAKRIGGTCKAFPVYLHPAPPPAGEHVPETAFGNTERSALIARLRLGASISRERRINEDFAAIADDAADMLEADALQLDKKTVWIAEVKPGWALVPIVPTPEMITAGRDAPVSSALEDIDADYCAVYKAMLAAAHGAKP